MKNSTDKGFNQHYNAQVAVDQDGLLIVGTLLSNHPTDRGEVVPTLAAIPVAIGIPAAAALDAGYFSAANIEVLQGQGIEAYIATGHEAHHWDWQSYFTDEPTPHRAMPVRRSRWSTSCERRWARQSTGCGNARWSQ